MANPNDMPEFHSVKVSLTENIPSRQYPPTTHAADLSNSSNTSSANTRARVTLIGGQYHV